MITSTALDEIEALAARHHAREATRNAPKVVAIRAIYTLVSALADLSDADHYAVKELLRAELAVLDQRAWDQLGAALAD